MTSYHHNQHDVYHDNPPSRSPGSHRHQPQTLHRQLSRQFDAYGPMPTAPSYAAEDPMARYDTSRMDRLNFNHTMHNGQFNNTGPFGYDMGGASTWNPNANGFGGAPTLGMGATGRMKPSRGRAGLPTTWLDQQPGLPQYSGLGPSPLSGPQIRHDSMGHDLDDELIPTAIVIKNIPFAVKKEQLVALMTEMNLPLPYAFNYHFDNGVFRGLAFANFTSADETAAVIDVLNHFELQGRKLRVEYKKMLPLQERERIEREKRERRGQLEEQHRPITNSQLHSQTSMSSLSSHMPPAASPSPVSQRDGKPGVDLNDPQTLEFYTQLIMFKSDYAKESWIFPTYLTPEQRRTVHTLAHQMGLGHVSRGQGDARQVHVTRVPTGTNVSPPNPTLSTINASDAARRGLNRAATIDFGEQRGSENNHFNTLRGQGSAGLLGVAESSLGAFGNQQNLRAAKSFADLRSYTPSPVPSSASFSVLQPNGGRFGQLDGNASASSNTPTLTPTASAAGLGLHRDDGQLVNGLSNMSLGTGIVGPNAGSPRRLRGIFSWDQDPQFPSTAPIGSNRTIGVAFDNQSQDRSAGPMRQPRGPAERGPGFRRQNGHRGSDEMRGNSGVEIIVE